MEVPLTRLALDSILKGNQALLQQHQGAVGKFDEEINMHACPERRLRKQKMLCSDNRHFREYFPGATSGEIVVRAEGVEPSQAF